MAFQGFVEGDGRLPVGSGYGIDEIPHDKKVGIRMIWQCRFT